MSFTHRLGTGDLQLNFIDRRKLWFILSGVVLTVCVLSMVVRGFQFGIEFRGGASFQFPSNGHTVEQARNAVASSGVNEEVVQSLSSGDIRVQTPPLTDEQITKVQQALAKEFGLSETQLSPQTVSSSWGSQVTKKALYGLGLFLVLVMAYISIRFEPKMAAAAIISVFHDLVVTAGVYSLVGFEVTPSTVIALLTILGFSLYDTVVVFDKVKENTAGLTGTSRMTYGEATNLALNQTLMRSINTSVIALLPVGALLFVGAGLLGAGTLKDLALAQFVGLASGAYSSLFVAAPLLVVFKEREPVYRALEARLARSRAARAQAAASAAVPANELEAVGVDSRAGGLRAAGAASAAGAGPDRVGGADDDARAGGPAEAGDAIARRSPPRGGARPGNQRRTPAGRGRPGGKRKR